MTTIGTPLDPVDGGGAVENSSHCSAANFLQLDSERAAIWAAIRGLISERFAVGGDRGQSYRAGERELSAIGQRNTWAWAVGIAPEHDGESRNSEDRDDAEGRKHRAA